MKFITTCFALAACALALLSTAPAAADVDYEPEANGCYYLTIELQNADYKIDGVRCEEGEVVERRRSEVILVQGNGARTRIEAEVSFVNAAGGSPEPNVVRFTQNRCVLKAGNIHVRQVSGWPPIYRDYEGSYGNRRPGKVIIKGFRENYERPDWLPDPLD